MAKEVMLKTEFLKGWTATAGEFPIFELTPGEGVSIENGVISIAHVDGVEGTYTNPIVSIDGYGRVSAIQNGAAPSALNADVLETDADVDSYAGTADALLVLDAGNGRSALYMRGSDSLFKGPAFITGERGVDGVNGVDGATGAKGDKGEKGDEGQRGADGLQGLRGVDGPEGPRGQAGANGLDGAQGIQGPEGPMGSFLTPDEYGNIDEDAIARIQAGGVRHFFLVNPAGDLRADRLTPSGISGDMQLHLIGYSPSSGWTDYGQLTGAQGPRGPQGVKGDPGEAGPQGAQGNQGSQGVQGPEGPRGLQGLKGDTGLQGVPGPAGPAGPAGAGGVGSIQEYWTENVRTLTSADSGRTIAVSAAVGITIAADGWTLPVGHGFVDIAVVGTAPGPVVVTYGAEPQKTRTLYPGETTRFSGDNVLILKRAPRCLLAEQTLTLNTKLVSVPNMNLSLWEEIEVELVNFRPSASNMTLSYQARQGDSSATWSGQNVGPQQATSSIRLDGSVVFRPGLRVGTIDTVISGTTAGYQNSFRTGSNDSITDARFFYGNYNDFPTVLAGAQVRMYGINRIG